jgi:hypothetical protein
MIPSGRFISGVITLRKWPMKSRDCWIKSTIELCDWTLAQSYDAWYKRPNRDHFRYFRKNLILEFFLFHHFKTTFLYMVQGTCTCRVVEIDPSASRKREMGAYAWTYLLAVYCIMEVEIFLQFVFEIFLNIEYS